jgi:hypothetical protein
MDSKTSELSRYVFGLWGVPRSRAKKHDGLHCLSGIDGVIDPIEFFQRYFSRSQLLDAGGEFPKPTQRIGELHLSRSPAVRLK